MHAVFSSLRIMQRRPSSDEVPSVNKLPIDGIHPHVGPDSRYSVIRIGTLEHALSVVADGCNGVFPSGR